jgi:iron complex transport system ATP-binding protein
MHALTVENISFSYDLTVPTLRGVSLAVHKEEILSLIGPNGSGKTTLLRLLDRIYLPQEGRILFDQRDITTYSRSDLARRIAFVPQENTILFPFTVLEIILMGRSPHTKGIAFENAHDREVALRMMKLTDIEHLADHSITALSGGERQRVLIARALAQEPELLLLDEPNAHLDIAHQVDIFSLIRKLNKESGLTVVSVSHDLNLAAAFSNRIAMLVCGSVTATGSPTEVLTEAHIREVFNANVIVDEHPAGGMPRVTPTFG